MLSPASLFSLGAGLVTSLTAKSGTQMPHQLPNPYRNNNAQTAWNLQRQNTNAEADLENQQGQIDLSEGQRNAAAAGLDAKERLSAMANAYDNSGVMPEGSPMIVMEHRRQQMQQVIDANMAHQVALAQLASQHAQITRNEGLVTLMGQQNANATSAANFDAQQAMDRISHLSSNSPTANFIKSLQNLLPGFVPPVKTPGGGSTGGGSGNSGGGSPGGSSGGGTGPQLTRNTMPPVAPDNPFNHGPQLPDAQQLGLPTGNPVGVPVAQPFGANSFKNPAAMEADAPTPPTLDDLLKRPQTIDPNDPRLLAGPKVPTQDDPNGTGGDMNIGKQSFDGSTPFTDTSPNQNPALPIPDASPANSSVNPADYAGTPPVPFGLNSRGGPSYGPGGPDGIGTSAGAPTAADPYAGTPFAGMTPASDAHPNVAPTLQPGQYMDYSNGPEGKVMSTAADDDASDTGTQTTSWAPMSYDPAAAF